MKLWAPHDPENFADPFPMYKRLRENDPVHKSQTGEWIVSTYEHVRKVLKDPQCLTGNRLRWMEKGISYLQNRDEDMRAIADALNSFLLFKNPPDHMRIRKFILECWSDRDLAAVIQQIVSETLSPLSRKKSFDIVSEFAQLVPARTVGTIMGIPDPDYLKLKQWSTNLVKALDLYVDLSGLMRIQKVSQEFISYFRNLIRHAPPRKGLLATIIEENNRRNLLDENEMISICILLFVAGEETTSSMIATGLFILLGNQEFKTRFMASAEASRVAFEELLRYAPPVHLTGRITGEPMRLGDKDIPAGETLTLLLASANRDEAEFADPDALIPDRSPNRHLSFGNGAHYCIGDWLARLQGQIAIPVFLDRFPSLKLITTLPEWNDNLSIRRLKELVVG